MLVDSPLKNILFPLPLGEDLRQASVRTSFLSSRPHAIFENTLSVLSCDGSATTGPNIDVSGWGFTVASSSSAALRDYCGPTVLDPNAPGYIGADHHSNNIGELSALYFALSWVRDHVASSPSSPPIIIEYDSEYAAGVAQRHARGRTNLRLVLRVRHIFDLVARYVVFRKVESHTGQYLNERADHLAECGANGILCGPADVHRWAGLSG